MTEKELFARDAKRNIGEELLEALKGLKAGRFSHKTTFGILSNGKGVRRCIERADGTVEKDEILTGPRWEMMAARAISGLSQSDFAQALGGVKANA